MTKITVIVIIMIITIIIILSKRAVDVMITKIRENGREWLLKVLKNSREPACIKMSLQKFLKENYKVLDWKSLKL